MSKNKIVRFSLYALAIWAVLSLATLTVTYLFKFGRQALQPSVSSIVTGLKSSNKSERKAALDKIKHPVWSEPAIIAAVSEMALVEENPYMQSRAISMSVHGYDRYANMNREQLTNAADKPALTLDKIDRISSLVLEEKPDSYLDHERNQVYRSLYIFLQNTVKSQSDPNIFISHLTRMLNSLLESKPAYPKAAKIADLLQTLKGYATYVVLPDETMTALLAAYQREDIQNSYSAVIVMDIFNQQASKQEFRKDILGTVEHAAIEHKNTQLRLTSISVLRQQSLLTGRLPPALKKAVNDENDWNARVASSAIARFNESQGAITGQGSEAVLATAFDKTLNPRLRATALRTGIAVKNGKTSIAPEFFNAAESLRDDPEPDVRAASLYYIRYMWNHDLYRQRQRDLQDWLETALNDSDARVRVTALSILQAFPEDDSKRSKYVANALKDGDRRVLLEAMRIMRLKQLNTPEIVEQIRHLTRHEDTAVRSTATRYLQILETKNRNVFQNARHILGERENLGGLLYFAAAVVAIAIAAGFSVFYAYRFIKQTTEKQLKAVATFGVLLVWAGATYALGFSFVFGAFGMGHNAPAPLKEQLLITAILAGFIVGYGVLGYLMYLFVREPKRKMV